MNAYQLFREDGTPARVWMCASCGKGYHGKSEEIAERCCRCDVCGEPLDKAKDFSGRHRNCQTIRSREIAMKRIEKAEKLDSWDGPVFNDEHGNGDDTDYYESVENMIDDLLSRGRKLPEYAFVCEVEPAVNIDLSRIIDNIELPGEMDDTVLNVLDGIPELEAAIDKFNAANDEIKTWREDYSRVVRVRAEEEDER